VNNEVATTDESEVVSGLPAGYNEGSASLAVSLARAEVDQQIATARALPRSISRAVANILSLATLDPESAEECIYALPRAGKAIKGPSIRLAEIVAGQWGNCRVGARVVHVDRLEKYVEAEGVFHDLETNTATTSRVRRRLSDRKGRLLSEDMIVVTGNAACSIAKRNAILGGVPRAVWRKAYEQVEQVIAGDIKTLAERRDVAFKHFAAWGVSPEQIFQALGVAGLDDIGLDHLSTLQGFRSAIKNGEETVETLFAPVKAVERPSNAEAIERLANGKPAVATEPEKKEVLSTEPDDDGDVIDHETGEVTNVSDAPAAETPAPETGSEGEAASPSSSQSEAASAPSDPPLSVDDAKHLKALHNEVIGYNSTKRVTAACGAYADKYKPGPRHLAVVAIIEKVHRERIEGKSSPAECDNTVRNAIAFSEAS